MKRLAIVVIVLAVILGGIALNKTRTIEYVQNEPTVVEKEVEVDALDTEIKSRQNAVSEATEAIGKKAYEDAVEQENKKIELQVIKEFNEKLNARQIELEKETKVY